MSHHRPSHRKKSHSSKEFYSYKRSSANKIGAKVLRTGSIVSKPGHKIGLYKEQGESPYDNGDDLSSLRPETFATDILSSFDTPTSPDNPEFSGRQLGKQLLESIDKENDSQEIIALKELGAKICGVRSNDTDYQQIMTTLDNVMTADDLRDFIMYLHEWSHADAQDSEQYINEQMNELSGFRVEASFVRLAESAGLSFRPATRYEDHHGLDFMVEGVPFDLKSSEQKAKQHVKKHKNDTNRFDAIRFVPPITSEDFDGRLVVPYENAKTIVETTNFKSLIIDAIQKYKETHGLARTA